MKETPQGQASPRPAVKEDASAVESKDKLVDPCSTSAAGVVEILRRVDDKLPGCLLRLCLGHQEPARCLGRRATSTCGPRQLGRVAPKLLAGLWAASPLARTLTSSLGTEPVLTSESPGPSALLVRVTESVSTRPVGPP